MTAVIAWMKASFLLFGTELPRWVWIAIVAYMVIEWAITKTTWIKADSVIGMVADLLGSILGRIPGAGPVIARGLSHIGTKPVTNNVPKPQPPQSGSIGGGVGPMMLLLVVPMLVGCAPTDIYTRTRQSLAPIEVGVRGVASAVSVWDKAQIAAIVAEAQVACKGQPVPAAVIACQQGIGQPKLEAQDKKFKTIAGSLLAIEAGLGVAETSVNAAEQAKLGQGVLTAILGGMPGLFTDLVGALEMFGVPIPATILKLLKGI